MNILVSLRRIKIKSEKYSIKYEDKTYVLKIIYSQQNNVIYDSRYIYLYTKYLKDSNKKKEIYERWLRKRSKEIFNRCLDNMYLHVEDYEVKKPSLSIRRMKSRW